ncbi:MAG: DUF2971 domain-containing protein [Rhodospirillaceae bacterium]|nr:DUF2971 domain-containing protein [Rhodospirillaceae bacterium]
MSNKTSVEAFFSQAERDKYSDLIFELLMRAAHSRRPDTTRPLGLYHYTTMENLPAIVASGTLWATHISTMNDASEVLHPVKLVRRAIKQRLGATTNVDAQALLRAMDTECKAIKDVILSGIMVICFSERRNDLSQWRAYGGALGGAAIKFDGATIGSQQNGMTLLPVIYSPKLKREIMEAYVVGAEKLFLERLASLRKTDAAIDVSTMAKQLCEMALEVGALAAPIFKHCKFHHEREWRLVLRLSDADIKRLEFVPRATMMSVHLPMRFGVGKDDDGKPMLPIQAVVVGPTAHPKLHMMVASEILRKKGYNLSKHKVTSAKIPFRPAR